MAHKCRRLRQLSLAHCKAVSDVGLLAVSQKCTMLQELNLFRTELPFKVCRRQRADDGAHFVRERAYRCRSPTSACCPSASGAGA